MTNLAPKPLVRHRHFHGIAGLDATDLFFCRGDPGIQRANASVFTVDERIQPRLPVRCKVVFASLLARIDVRAFNSELKVWHLGERVPQRLHCEVRILSFSMNANLKDFTPKLLIGCRKTIAHLHQIARLHMRNSECAHPRLHHAYVCNERSCYFGTRL
jgi:hypothetical protein